MRASHGLVFSVRYVGWASETGRSRPRAGDQLQSEGLVRLPRGGVWLGSLECRGPIGPIGLLEPGRLVSGGVCCRVDLFLTPAV